MPMRESTIEPSSQGEVSRLLSDPVKVAPRDRLSILADNLLLRLIEEHRCDRVFFLLRELSPGSGTDHEISIVSAFAADRSKIDTPDYFIDTHYLVEIGGHDGCQFLPGGVEGITRPLLTCSFPLALGTRGIFLLEFAPGETKVSQEETDLLCAFLEVVLEPLRDSFTISTLSHRVVELEGQLDGIEGLLEDRELELGGLRSVIEVEGFVSEDVTCYHDFLTRSSSVQEVLNDVDRLKNTDLSVLIQGETGTGKELLARAMHFGGNRSQMPFEVVSCGSLAPNLVESELFGYRKGAFSGADEDRPGIFERSDGGTIYLDEVGDMPIEMQQKLLRSLQEGVIRPIGSSENVRVNVRVIASTRHDLTRLIAAKTFREDLYYRLSGFTIEVPPLRDRREDVPLLLNHFLEKANEEQEAQKRFSESAQRELYQYNWPGNAQELQNVVTRAVLTSPRRVIARKVILPLLRSPGDEGLHGIGLTRDGEELVLRVPATDSFNDIVSEVERLVLVTALYRNRGNKSRVTKQLGIPRQTLYNKLDRYAIEEDEYS